VCIKGVCGRITGSGWKIFFWRAEELKGMQRIMRGGIVDNERGDFFSNLQQQPQTTDSTNRDIDIPSGIPEISS